MVSFELSIQAILERSKEKVLHTLMIGPSTGAVCSLEKIEQMVNKLYDVKSTFIGELK